ncbi:MAG: glutamate--tRNA ligase [Candidatus Ryanbacteria bacterium RIFCSPHIGHO2_02_FULL_45_43]|uniref:Glutamate--tRNA ligase n=1 Tax=Candidatus Ryanbacteria bacterium RIFCSPHIGHO2_01_45_13 TaxID=1802112 RepID=A0A1G2FY08_9BACT|nr:MAG: glutamate--tRNA ligase [Candidatus Ryanbacteria bacterium RIFCSPHIGHO2_01_FULL_44_130]OGZ42965.1 MAG: glutamate--tRNA ligase [Candidatus Ryanbacteria bacterium RIFCSPHIGHO2_01_45_13]OGZ48670.1 MAG: glutamate--tRNA ligase [Candidatus Ryanbacteria bacterium RIFCSPHIGHO2_02_FULL_45_43]OGZ50610.1 MAG: glutamate--tRNA ligase [Candidatus Ryanbacteria bacterium RIFCSPHIGHO2_12_FULL_44_20]OGZ51916.1 MAG: glutamate--tRNA ligase [Candidatus Ryanbacteria bacterium RIFCSPLOWO2_01_FULL_44_230]OGZ53
MMTEPNSLHFENVRVRIAPSPSGFLHIGTARTALFNWLFAKKHNGSFILRFEDTDRERSKKEFEYNIREGLEWLGITWDEEYRQSERPAVYQTYLEKLLSGGWIYRCPHRIEQSNTPHICPFRDQDETEEGIFRFKNNEKKTITFNDMVRGAVSFNPKDLGDFSIAVDFSRPLFIFAGVVDDKEMHISHVIRGEDHLSNTPKQILVGRALGFPEPKWAHIPLILEKNRSKLSKRDGATSILDYREMGYLPNALLNFMALMGWHPLDDTKEIISPKELIAEFSVERIQKGGAVFNIDKLNWMNKQYINNLTDKETAQLFIPHLMNAGLIKPEIKNIQFPAAYGGYTPTETYVAKDGKSVRLDYIIQIAALEKPRIEKLSDITVFGDFFFCKPQYDLELLSWKGVQPLEDIRRKLDITINLLDKLENKNFTKNELEGALIPIAEKEGKGELLWPLRAALSGKKASPGPFEIMEILGKETTIERLKEAKKRLLEHVEKI